MEFLENNGNKKQKMKKKEVSLTDEEYNDLFNSVISSNLTNEIFDGLINSNSENNDSDKENVDPAGSFNISKTANGQDKSKEMASNKKKIPKFNIPSSGKVNNHINQRKFVPPQIKIPPPQIVGSSKHSFASVLKNQKNLNKKANEVVPAVKVNQELQDKNTTNLQVTNDSLKEPKDKTYKKNVRCQSSDNNNKINNKEKTKNKPTSKKKTTDKEPLRSITYTARQCSSTSSQTDSSSGRSSSGKSSSEDEQEHTSSKPTTWSQRSDGCSHFSLSGSLATQLSQPPPSLCQRGRLEWLRQRRDVGVWVQCCDTLCAKWRYLDNVKDPAEVPHYWVCAMNNDPRFNSCAAPERGPSLSEHIDLIDNKFTAGSVVWARLTGFPWWPALVDDDPDVEAYYWLNGFSDIPTHYHVVFFDKREVTRAWITPDNLKRFLDSSKEPTLRAKDSKYSSRIEFAKQQACKALDFDLKSRLLKFGFLAQYKGHIGKKGSDTPDNEIKSRKRKEYVRDNSREKTKEDKIKVTKRKRCQIGKECKTNNLKEKEKSVKKVKATSAQNRTSEKSQTKGKKSSEFLSHNAENRTNAGTAKEAENDDFDPFKDDEDEKNENSEALVRAEENTFLTEGCSNVATVGTNAFVEEPTDRSLVIPLGSPKHKVASQSNETTCLNNETKESDASNKVVVPPVLASDSNQSETAAAEIHGRRSRSDPQDALDFFPDPQGIPLGSPKHKVASQSNGTTSSNNETKVSDTSSEVVVPPVLASDSNQSETAAAEIHGRGSRSDPQDALDFFPDPQDAVVPTISQEVIDDNLSDPFEDEE